MSRDVVQLAEAFLDERDCFVRAGFARVRRAQLCIGRFKRRTSRDCCLCDTESGVITIHAEIVGELSWNQIIGLLRHELAHVASPDLSEGDTDLLAEDVSGAAIRYGTDDIQTIGRGVHPRPSRLPRR